MLVIMRVMLHAGVQAADHHNITVALCIPVQTVMKCLVSNLECGGTLMPVVLCRP